jgi:predicted RND superfamily exporter protein
MDHLPAQQRRVLGIGVRSLRWTLVVLLVGVVGVGNAWGASGLVGTTAQVTGSATEVVRNLVEL